MNTPAPISNYSELVTLLQKMYTLETPSVAASAVTEEAHPEDTTLSKSDQERIRDLSQYLLSLPIPYLTPAQLQEITTSWPERFSIMGITGASSAFSPVIGLMEGAILTTAVQEWARSELDSAELLRETMAQEAKNPLALILQKYVQSHPTGSLAGIDLKQTLASLPVLSALLQMAPADLLAKAYLLSEQQIINTMLERWSESERKNAEAAREDAKQQNLVRGQLREELMAQLLAKSRTSETPPPALFSIVIFGCLFEPQAIGVETLGSTVIKSIVTSVGLPETLVPELGMLGQGLMLSALTWAAPSAVSLLKFEGSSPSEKEQSLVATRAYCLSLLRTLEDPAVSSFLQSRMTNAVAKGLMTQEEAVQTYAVFRALLLINASIILYSQETGGVTPQEIRALIEGKLKLSEDSLLKTFGTFIRIEMSSLTPEQRESLLSSGLEKLVDNASNQNISQSIQVFLAQGNTKYNHEITLSTKG